MIFMFWVAKLERKHDITKGKTYFCSMKKAIFPGSFDPFTVGHANIVARALPLFDRIVIGVGINAGKSALYGAEERVERIRRIYAGDDRISVVCYDDLTVDLARREGADVIVRGVRGTRDFEYEREVAAANRRLAGIETVLIPCDENLACVSSSLVRELIAHGRDVTEFLPAEK